MAEKVSEECKLALKASMELIGEKCQLPLMAAKTTVEVPGVGVIGLTEEVTSILKKNPELTRAQRIEAVSESEWAQHWGASMCRLTSPDLAGSELERCRDRLARILAERVTA